MSTTNIQAFSGDVEVAGELNVTGTLTSTTGVDKVTLATDGTNANRPVVFSTGATGAQNLRTDPGLTYNPANNYLNTTANHAQDADYAGDAGTVYSGSRDANNTNAQYLLFTTSHADGQKALYADAGLYYNPSSGLIGANLSGRANHAQDADGANHAQDADAANHAQDADRANHAQDADGANRAIVLANYVYVTSGGSGANKVTRLLMTEDDDITYFQFRNQQSILNREITAHCQGYFEHSSDDRLKVNERYLTDGLDVIKRLKPQVYDKRPDLVENMIEQGYDSTSVERKEVGFIAQDIYYQVPELRHIVSVGGGTVPDSNVVISDDPTVDPDYSSWSNVAAGIHYTEVIPYNTAAIQELSNLRDSDVDRITVLESQVSDLLTRVQTLETGGS